MTDAPTPDTQHPTPNTPWTVLDSEYLHRSPWRSLRTDRLRTHTGEAIAYTYLETPAAVFVVPLTTDGRIALIRQYRHPVGDWAWEVPAGAHDEGDPELTARRELAEEVGGRCRELIPLSWSYPSPAHLRMRSYAFLATDVALGPSSLEPTELLEVVLLDPEEAFARARDGRVNEGQSALALLKAEPLIRERLAGRPRPRGR